jgi:hypothetical protein
MLRIAFCLGLCLLLPLFVTTAQAEDAAFSVEQIKFFETHVRPLLIEKCFKCHSDQKQSGEFRLDSRGALLAGGESGPALDLEHPEKSLLLEAVRYESYEMPPDGKLPDDKIAILEQWVALGAPWPGDQSAPTQRVQKEKITDEDRQFWSFQPLKLSQPPTHPEDHWSRTEIDRFLFDKLLQHGLTPAPEADQLTLVRRLYFNLIGLPPSPEEIDRFLSNNSPTAYEDLVDELLSSPRYGENWARFWLDLVRYAESDGYRKDDFRPDAWRYRDYVIQAFNADKPYDQFVREQIAGDELAPHDPQALAATGFFRHGIYEYNQRDAETQWQDMLNDITDTTGDVLLGVGMGCARCHDHKFDPILQADYFRLQAFFANLSFRDDLVVADPDQLAAYTTAQQAWEARTADLRSRLSELEAPHLAKLRDEMVYMFPEHVQAIWNKPEDQKTAYEKQLSYLIDLQILDNYTKLPTKFKGEEKKLYEELKAELAKFDAIKPSPLPTCRGVSDFGNAPPPVFIPGKERLGEVQPGFLTILEPEPVTPEMLPQLPDSSGRRSVLAHWLTRPDHPLTTRVIVNRIWQQHFGMGIVATPSDFGHLGEPPTHPELLDWLAVNFVHNGWSLKWLHRQIVTSAAWRQQSLVRNAAAEEVDPTNRLLWRAPLKRLVAEQVRDALLSVTGELEHSAGGPPQDGETSRRRAIYAKVLRNTPVSMLNVLDFPDRIRSAGERNTTTTPSQALLLINSTQALKRAEAFARRLAAEIPGPADSQVRQALRIAFGRDPEPDELELLTNYLESHPEAAETARVAFAPLPELNTAGLQLDAEDSPAVEFGQKAGLLGNKFTLEATVRLESIFPDASVRTILAQWDSNTARKGWSLGVTSEKSKYAPRNLILQLVGHNPAGVLTSEVVASGLFLELNRPYRLSVAVDLEDTSEAGIEFQLTNLTTGETQLSRQKHVVTSQIEPDLPLVIGGRSDGTRHRWHGQLAEICLTTARLTPEQLQVAPPARELQPLAHWSLAGTLADSQQGWLLSPSGPAGLNPALVDLCHVLLNANEFLYLD